MGTATIIDQAFVDMAFFQGLITPVSAVLLLVAYFGDVYAFPTPALELSRTQALIDVFAVDFVRAVNTVSDAVALPAAVDAAAIFTFELVRSAGSRGAAELVAAVPAVRIAVAAPFLVNALARAALDLAGGASGVDHWLPAALLQRLIRLVRAVRIVIAHPAERDAGGCAALELVGAAGRGRAVQLVSAVVTVVLAVAHEVPGDTAATGAGELIGTACDVATVFFIFSIVTIIFTIASPGHWDTLSGTGATADFIYAACSHMALFWAFIRTIFTVGIPITLPSVRNTLAVFAHKVRFSTGLLHTVLFITAISTVFISVTFPQQSNAAAICALELGAVTFAFFPACSGAAVPGRPAQREQQPQRPARGRAHAARPDGAAAAAVVVAVRSAQQVTSPPIPGACPNFLIQGTCGRSSCALPSSLLYPSGAAAKSADATIAAVASASGMMELAFEGSGGQQGALSLPLLSP